MKVREVVERLPEKPKESVFKCYEKCGLPNMEAELEPEVDRELLEFLKALSNPIRLKILKLTRDEWLCVCLLSEVLGVEQTLVSHHLRTLKTLGLLKERREGRMRFYRVDRGRIAELFKRLEEALIGNE